MRSLAVKGEFGLAFSGGLDSRFLACFAQQAGLHPILLHAKGPHYPLADSTAAIAWAMAHNLELRVIASNPLELPQVVNNAKDRCYHCKFYIFSQLKEQNLPLADGSHATDANAYRPGLLAGAELGVTSPLALAGMSKANIRQAAADLGLDNPNQRARPCLLTRFAYGLTATVDMLDRLDMAESGISELLRTSLDNPPDFRLRLLQDWKLELHFAAKECPNNALTPLTKNLENIVFATMQMPLSRLRHLKVLSGFFDQNGLN